MYNLAEAAGINNRASAAQVQPAYKDSSFVANLLHQPAGRQSWGSILRKTPSGSTKNGNRTSGMPTQIVYQCL
jgi:hypothetical protein